MSHDVIKKKDSNLNSQSAKWQDLENLTLNSEILQVFKIFLYVYENNKLCMYRYIRLII